MKYLLLALTIIPFLASADPRIEVNSDNTFCHVPYDEGNADNQILLQADHAFLVVNEETGVASGMCEKISWIPRRYMEGIVSESSKLRSIAGFKSDAKCTLVDSNNTQYVSNATWFTRIQILKMTTGKDSYKVKMFVRCFAAKKQ